MNAELKKGKFFELRGNSLCMVAKLWFRIPTAGQSGHHSVIGGAVWLTDPTC